MLKNFHNIKLNSLTEKKLSFWEKDFDKVYKKTYQIFNQKS